MACEGVKHISPNPNILYHTRLWVMATPDIMSPPWILVASLNWRQFQPIRKAGSI